MPQDNAAQHGAADEHRASGAITVETVQHLAGLSRIALTDTELESLTSELGSILTNIAKVSEVAGGDVPATSHPIPI
ncbi:MAG: aspartyl/glutamyl-tRNA amidotransferase subunit C, partial [Actinobacteria bacterium]|nr:aspartyl/glutamyl-tRNA amidotransferase subunit C [Actinomycetota bacterium]